VNAMRSAWGFGAPPRKVVVVDHRSLAEEKDGTKDRNPVRFVRTFARGSRTN